MVCALRAERRWVLTGTPTPATAGAQVSALQPLLAFLREEPYGSDQKAWDDGLRLPFEAGRVLGASHSRH